MTESNAENIKQESSGANSGLVQISQGALDGLVATAKREAAEKARAAALSDIDKIREEAIRDAESKAEMAAERKVQEMERKRFEEKNDADIKARDEAIKGRLVPKFAEGDKKYTDWKETVGSYNWQKDDYAQILPLLAEDGIDNPEDVLHHICENNHVEKLASKNPAFILSKLKEISSSIKSSQKQSNIDFPAEPIKSLKPSYTKTKGDGDLTIEDFRKAKWLKN